MEESHQQREQTLNGVCVCVGGGGGGGGEEESEGQMKASDVSERERTGER